MDDSACELFHLMMSAHQSSQRLAKLASVDSTPTIGNGARGDCPAKPAGERRTQCLDSHGPANTGITPRFLIGELTAQKTRTPC
jgi:hypothetical protein